MSEPSHILEAARAIRPYLPTLLDAEPAAQIDGALAALLAAGGHDAEDRILVELDRHNATRDWAAGYIELGLPPDLAQYAERSFSEAPGYGDPVRIPKFDCPHGDYAWYRHDVGEEPPRCPTHGVVVEPVDA